MYDRILVPTDGSEIAEAAAKEALRLAGELGATVHVIFVIDESASSFLLAGDTMAQVLDRLRSEGEEAVASIADDAGDVSVVTDIIRGTKIDTAIVEYADANDIDLVVMGTSGRHGVDHLLGSTTERVLSAIDIPTLVVGD